VTSWLLLLGGLLVWTVHFFGLYAIAEFAPSTRAVLMLTALCLGVDLAVLRGALRLRRGDAFSAWRRSVAVGGAALSLVAIGWQALPALVD
jgi:hypothetical protein